MISNSLPYKLSRFNFWKKVSVVGLLMKKNLSNCKRMPHLLLLALSSVTEVKNTAKVTKCLPRCHRRRRHMLPASPTSHLCCLSLLHGRHRGAARALPPARRTKVAYSRKPLLSVEYRSDRVAWRCDVRDSLLGVEPWAYGVKRVRSFCILSNFVCFFVTEVTQFGRLHMRKLGQTSLLHFPNF